MSECVVRMEMPKHCGECELKTWYIWPGSFKCVKTMHDIMSHIQNRTKPNDCPIICQLPEGHDRLVDADKFIEHLFTKWQNGEISNSEWCDMRQWVNEETTIVPE